MVVKNLSLLTALALSGCATFDTFNESVDLDEQYQDSEFTQDFENDSTSKNSFQHPLKQEFQQQQQSLKRPLTVVTKETEEAKHDINYYVRGLMQDLVANLQYVNSTTPVAVVSFVMLDSDYNDANILGIQIAESLIHEVHKFGIPVIDFKTTGYIRVTEQGDFAFSKDYEDFSGEMPARYIVGGTMLKHSDGYLINARIIGVQSQTVVASAQSFIPNNVSDPILKMSAIPTSPNLFQNVKLGSVTYSSTLEPTLGNLNNYPRQQASDPTSSSNKIVKVPLTKQVFLIQE